MKSRSALVFVLLAEGAFMAPGHAFQNGQHQNISQQAINNAGATQPDIQKFGSLINSWSWGIGTSANLTTEQTLETLFTIKGNPAEELAHLEDQQRQIDATASINGGNYDDIVNNKVRSAFLGSNFSNTAAQSEGAYVWMGAALHLIEDQASTPHGANIIHGVGDNFEGPLNQNGQKVKSFVFTANTAAGTALGDLYNKCLTTTQSKIPNFKNFSYSPAARLWLLNSELSGFSIDGSNGFGRYGGVILSPPLSDTPNFLKSVPADIYSEPPSGPSIFTDQSTQAGDFGTNFLIQMSKSLPPLVSELSIAGAGAGGASAIINAQTGNLVSFRISENRTQAVTVNVYIQDTNQNVVSDAATLMLSSARSADGTFKSTTLPSPITWNNNQVPLWGTLNDGSVFALTLLPFDSQLQFNWNGQVVGAPLADGTHTLCVTATPHPSDASSNASQPVCQNLIVSNTPPALTVTAGSFIIGDGMVTPEDIISASAVPRNPKVAVTGLDVFQAPAGGDFQHLFSVSQPSLGPEPFDGNFWYFVRACDVARNCEAIIFGIFPPGSNPAPPGSPPPGPPGGKTTAPPVPPNPAPGSPPQPPVPPYKTPGPPVPPAPPCLASSGNPSSSMQKCAQGPFVPPVPQHYCHWYPFGCPHPVHGNEPHDPNFKSGTTGSVTPGQLMSYRVEFENTGQGTAYGVYVNDQLDPALDDTTLSVHDFNLITFSTSEVTTPASLPFSYDRATRTLTVFGGTFAGLTGASFKLDAKLRADAAPGTVISNQAIVYFPSVQEVTPTNSVVAAVPLPTQLAYVGPASITDLNAATLAAQLAAGSIRPDQQPVSMTLANSSFSALTDGSGVASTSLVVSTPIGSYNLNMSYAGDGFYYLPSAATAKIAITPHPTLLQAPQAALMDGQTTRLTLAFTDDQSQPLQRQAEEPKTVSLDAVDNGGVVTHLGSSLLSGTTVSFLFGLPSPARLSWTLRAQFSGDSRYAAAVSTGVLELITPIDALAGITSSNFNPGTIPSQPNDTLPPRTFLSVAGPSFSSGTLVYATNMSTFGLTAVDDLAIVGDGLGWGVSQTFIAVDTTTFSVYAGTFSLAAEGAHAIAAYSIDVAGNAEVVKSTSVAIDLTPPITSLQVLGSSSTDVGGVLSFTSATAVSFSAVDPTSHGVASGVNAIFYVIDRDPASPQCQSAPFDPGAPPGSCSNQTYAGPFTLSGGTHTLYYFAQDNVRNREVEHVSAITVRSGDVLPPRTTVSISSPQFSSGGNLYVTRRSSFTFSSVDDALAIGDALGVGTSAQYVLVDGVVRSTFTNTSPAVGQIFTSTLTLANDADGSHIVSFYGRDLVGNVESVHVATVAVDNTPPVTTVSVGAPQAALADGTLLVGPQTPIVLASTDPVVNGAASGVRQTSYQINSGVFTVYTATIALSPPDGPQTIGFFTQDNVLNTEVLKSTTVLLDSTPPLTAILAPAGPGAESVANGVFPVIGSVSDLHLANWRLESAPGAYASSGFTVISSGTVAVSSAPLGTWNTSALAGWQTLRLTAVDLVLNTTVVSQNVFIGDPQVQVVVGGRKNLNKPFDAAEGADGKIAVADANDNRVAVFTSTGGFLASFGSQGNGDDKKSASGLNLNKPKSVAVDAGGNIFIADTNDNRVLELSSAGQILLTIPGQSGNHHDDTGSGRGASSQFNHPQGIALDPTGNIYVSDTDNHRVQKFAPDGTFLLAFKLPAAPIWKGDDDEREDDAGAGRPVGIALDAAGAIYVADAGGNRVLKFDPTGALLQTFGAGTLKGPLGVAVSTSADTLVVSDSGNNRILKLDRFGNVNQTYAPIGNSQSDDDSRTLASTAPLNVPAELFLDAAGSLFAADRNNNRVLKFASPAAPPMPVAVAPIAASTTTVSVSSTTAEAPPAVARSTAAATGHVTKTAGGKVERSDRAAVVISSGALAADVDITVSTPIRRSDLEETVKTRKIAEASLVAISTGVEYLPEGTTFAAPVTLVLPYDSRAVAALGVQESDLRAYYWNRTTQRWDVMPGSVDLLGHVVNAQTLHFSLYQVMGPGTGGVTQPASAADQPFAFGQVYAYPNPARPGQSPTIHVEAGSADHVEVHIYDLSGQLKESTSADVQQGTFEFKWDVGGVGSGVYIYVVTASKTGAGKIRRTGRVGIIK